ncbi:hypothetical protein WJX73_005431 [Symbiochloris irregularis]|uniref:Uncharacterized protein n=1 Tax=Symbiochloris irregularis TaxID=706552 RepID=A0AAW1PJW0_9CHLO
MSSNTQGRASSANTARSEAIPPTETITAPGCSFEHLDIFPEEQRDWLQHSVDVTLQAQNDTDIATHAASLIQWSSVLGGCVTDTMPLGPQTSGQPLHRIPLETSPQVLTDMLRLLYSGNNPAQMKKLFDVNHDHYCGVNLVFNSDARFQEQRF